MPNLSGSNLDNLKFRPWRLAPTRVKFWATRPPQTINNQFDLTINLLIQRRADLTYDNSGYLTLPPSQPLMRPDSEYEEVSRKRHKQTILTQSATIIISIVV